MVILNKNAGAFHGAEVLVGTVVEAALAAGWTADGVASGKIVLGPVSEGALFRQGSPARYDSVKKTITPDGMDL